MDAGLSEEAARRARKRRVKDTAPAVKDMLKPLYAAKTLNKVRFHVAPLTGGNCIMHLKTAAACGPAYLEPDSLAYASGKFR